MDRSLRNYLPDILKKAPLFDHLTDAEQPEIDILWKKLEEALSSGFVEDATELGVLRYESMLDISPKGSDTILDRKFRILTRLSEAKPYTELVLNEKLKNLCGPDGYTCEVKHKEYVLKVQIGLSVKSQYDAVKTFLKRMTPANMVIDLSLKYNRHWKFEKYKHYELEVYTHEQLRSDEFANFFRNNYTDLKGYTHKELKHYTHKQLKSEVIS